MQFSQFFLEAVGVDSLATVQQLVLDDTLLFPPNAQHLLSSKAI